MKKVLLVIAMVAAGFTANAQEEKAKGGFAKQDLYISGTVGYNTVDEADAYTFSPSVGYFVSDNIALELGLTIGGSDTGATETNAFGVNLGANYFFTPENDFSFILGAGLSYVSEGSEVAGVEQADRNTFGIAIAPGINYFVSESIALRASVGALSYASSKVDVDGAESVNSFGLNLNLSTIQFGLTYKF
ncbi:OmpW family outer membrane protein [Tenacibaculum sp. HL-MS23]|uniref:outer membrane beta-barrel protein n=1 Tax=Tenacibaculum sp. HL-MS23 TaxID=3077734 RepID=UPI0028FC131B|nr:OmpW family outer membrane protein [Tenacibaculum sp. HL-MS23]WNW02318.1 OmpW family outer membrane protein [Tenacibaculum sp. HL-MS23]